MIGSTWVDYCLEEEENKGNQILHRLNAVFYGALRSFLYNTSYIRYTLDKF
jgi:hypothetical protein